MLFVGDDWAEDHHDIEIEDETGRRLARARLPEGIAGLSRLHELVAEHLTEDDVDPETGFVAQNVVIGIETDRGAWVAALVATGLPGVRDQSDVGCPLSGTACHLGGEV